MKVIDIEASVNGWGPSCQSVAIPSELILTDVPIGQGGILESDDFICVGSWRWDISSATSDEQSKNVATLIWKAKERGFKFLACDCVSVDQHDKANLMANLIKFSSLYRTHPVVVCYDSAQDLQRAWITSEIKIYGNRAFEDDKLGLIGCVEVRELFGGDVPGGPLGYMKTKRILRKNGIYSSHPLNWFGGFAFICQSLISLFSLPAKVVLCMELVIICVPIIIMSMFQPCRKSKAFAYLYQFAPKFGEETEFPVSFMLQYCTYCLTYILGLNWVAQRMVLSSKDLNIPTNFWLPELLRHLVNNKNGISLFHGDVLHIIANGVFSVEELPLLRRFAKKQLEAAHLSTPALGDESDTENDWIEPTQINLNDDNNTLPSHWTFLKELRACCGGGQTIGYGRNNCPKCKCRVFVLIHLVNRYIGVRLFAGSDWMYHEGTMVESRNRTCVLDWIDALGCERQPEKEDAITPRKVFLENIGLKGLYLVMSTEHIHIGGLDEHLDDWVHNDAKMLETLTVVKSLLKTCEGATDFDPV